jgi:hypothetical protein
MRASFFRILPLLAIATGLAACADDDGANLGNEEPEVLDRGRPRGRATIHFASPTAGAPDEICVLPQHIPGGDYKKGDDETETELCSYVFYGSGPRETGVARKDVALCPKLSSTNPGTDVYDLLPNTSREQTEATICKQDDPATKHLAKYKQSITCSYTPSILGYYHLSRALGGAGDVKPAVLRTMDLAEHKKITAEALTILRAQSDSEFPKKSWLTFRSAESDPAASRHKDNIYTSDLLQLYGGLQDNPRGEMKYSEINRRAAGDNPSGLFVRTPAWQRMTNSQPLSRIAGRTLADSAQIVVQMKDIAEMMVMDFLMSQQDRFGNIHAVEYFYFEKDGKIDKVKKSKVDDGEAPMPAGAVLVKKMLMKDNDCGGASKTNHAKNAGLIDQMRHMSPSLYKHTRWLAQNFAAGTPIPQLFVGEALFLQKDIDMLRANLASLDSKLSSMCKSGKLLLDLDLENHLAGKGHDPAACDVVGPPKP